MSLYIALLRAVNVAGHAPVAMTTLRAFAADLGFTDVQSVLQSGNLVFRSGARTSAGLERKLEAEAAKRLGLETDFLVRSAHEWRAIVARNPFPAESVRDPSHLVVVTFKGAIKPGNVKTLQAAIRGPEIVHADGKQAYIVYPAGIGRSRLTHSLIEKTLATRGTARNWNTVLKLAARTDA